MTEDKLRQLTIRNTHGMEVDVITFGATVTSIRIPRTSGKLQEVTLGFDTPEEYVRRRTHMGAIAGRVANRIANGRFALHGKTYQLNCNNGPNHLHGGPNGWAKVFWKIEGTTASSVRLKYLSVDGEENYPGNVAVTVTYSMDDQNGLHIEIEATTDAPTPVNPTNHCYFNLHEDHQWNILDHELEVHAATYTRSDAMLIPTGEIAPVENTPMDFREMKMVGQDFDEQFDQLQNAHGYDHNWILSDPGQIHIAARLRCPSNGLTLETYTNQPGIQCYTGNHLAGVQGRHGQVYQPQSGICLEAQGYPDAVNHPNFPSVILEPGERYHHHTLYRFT